MLNVCSLDCGYGDRQVLREINFSLADGQILVLIGPNGAGKSTLIKAISGILPPQAGRIELDGRDLVHCRTDERARLVAVVPQARNLPPAFTGWEVAAMGRTPYLNWLGQMSDEDETLIRQALEQTGTLEMANRPVGELSGGEQQRLLLARALVQQTRLLLLDEPTSHLDMQYQVHMIEILKQLVNTPLSDGTRRSAVVALHDLNLVERAADRVMLIVKGRIAAFGSPDEVMQPQILSEVYHVPLGVLRDEKTGLSAILPLP